MVTLKWISRLLAIIKGRTPAAPVQSNFPRRRLRLLLLSECAEDRDTIRRLAAAKNWDLVVSPTCAEAVPVLAAGCFAVVMFDRDLPGCDWREVMGSLVRSAHGSCVLLTSPVNDDYLWQEVIQHGGYDVLVRPLQDEQVCHTIDQAWWYWKIGWTQRDSSRMRPV